MSNELFLNLIQKMDIENISLSFGTTKETFNFVNVVEPMLVTKYNFGDTFRM